MKVRALEGAHAGMRIWANVWVPWLAPARPMARTRCDVEASSRLSPAPSQRSTRSGAQWISAKQRSVTTTAAEQMRW